jgi:ABC-type iron transport system FetAB permease component
MFLFKALYLSLAVALLLIIISTIIQFIKKDSLDKDILSIVLLSIAAGVLIGFLLSTF